MKRVLSAALLAAVLVFVVGAVAGAAEKKAAGEPKTMTIKGEVVDMGCYMGHGAKGASHKDCAVTCIAGGMPMGILTSQNKLYLVTLNHDNHDPYNKLKEWAGEMVSVTGTVASKNGVWAIDVTSAEPAATAASAK
jgi:hypothetical protein